ncbi:MAG: PEP-CTERM sorting domain-containing protein [Mariniblastus sp.]|nr:PEP-CTERM sorting domain-containing protein [Mariniblastus sp.]
MSKTHGLYGKWIMGFTGLMLSVCMFGSSSFGDELYDQFLGLVTSDGEIGWDVFQGAYTDTHTPDITGAANSGISVSPAGGIVTSTGNLYSLNTVPTFTISLAELNDDQDYTSVALQVATTGAYGANNFTLGGLSPTEFFKTGETVSAGFTYSYYWAEWQGVDSDEDLTAIMAGTPFNIHQSLAAVRFDYKNTGNSAYNMQAVPEPSSFAMMAVVASFIGLRRRRV